MARQLRSTKPKLKVHEGLASSKKAKVSKKPSQKRTTKVPKAAANKTGQAQKAGPTSPSRQMHARNAGRPLKYCEVEEAPRRKVAAKAPGRPVAASADQGGAPQLQAQAEQEAGSSQVEGQQAQLRVRVPTAEDCAPRGEGEGESIADTDDIRAGSSSSVLTRNVMDGGSGNEAARRRHSHLCYKCGREKSCAWRHGHPNGLFLEEEFCNSCGTHERRYGARFDFATGQVSYPESPQKKGGARGKAGTGGHVHHGANILLEAAAAGEGNGLQDNAAVASQGRAVGSGSSSRQGDVMGDGGSPPAALEGQAAMELGGSGGQQKGRRRVVVRKQSGPGAADVPNLGQEERQQPAQLGESKTAAPECLDSHVGNASSCLGGAPSRKRGASAASNSNMQDNKRAKTSNVAAFDNTAAHAAGGLQRGQHFGAAGRGQAGPGTEGATFGEMFGQHSKESAEEEMMSLGDSSDEQEVAKALLGMGSMVA